MKRDVVTAVKLGNDAVGGGAHQSEDMVHAFGLKGFNDGASGVPFVPWGCSFSCGFRWGECSTWGVGAHLWRLPVGDMGKFSGFLSKPLISVHSVAGVVDLVAGFGGDRTHGHVPLRLGPHPGSSSWGRGARFFVFPAKTAHFRLFSRLAPVPPDGSFKGLLAAQRHSGTENLGCR